MAASSSLKDYLKRYESNNVQEDKKKKKKKKPRTDAAGVLIVDEDPVWQKPVKIDEEEEIESPDEKPQVDEDIDVKRMKRLEQLRALRPYGAISEDGSGWVSVSDNAAGSRDAIGLSPPRRHRTRNGSLSPEPPHEVKMEDSDLSPPRMRRRHDSVSPGRKQWPANSSGDADLSPPRQRRRRHDSPGDADLSPPRQRRRRHDSPGDADLSPPRQRQRRHDDSDMSPPRQNRRRHELNSSIPGQKIVKETFPRRRNDSPSPNPDRKILKRNDQSDDISPPRRPMRKKTVDHENLNVSDVGDLSPQRRERQGSPIVSKSRGSVDIDLSPPRKSKVQAKTGLITGKDMREENMRKMQEERLKFRMMESGQGAETVYRDKLKGGRISKDEYLKSQKKEEKPKEEKKLEWGKGLAQKREAEAELFELELEKDKPFARTRDDPDLDKTLREAIRWGDPMAGLVKRKRSEPVLADLGDDEKMKESGFIIPQEIPSHSWIKRGLEAAPNRYGIRPGRHWDGVDRSNGTEKNLFKRTNEKRATEREAYLWSVADM